MEIKRIHFLFIEFIIIALGVLSALAVDTWIEERNEEKRAVVYRERLTADLQSDVVSINTTAAYYNQIRQYGLKVIADLEGRQSLDDFALLFAAFNAAEEMEFALESSTFDDMKNTGGMAVIDDVQLRVNLAAYYHQTEVRGLVWNLPRAYRVWARGIIPNALQAAIHENCTAAPVDFSQANENDPSARFNSAINPGDLMSASVDASTFCGLDVSQFPVASAAAEIRNEPETARLLRFRMSEARVAIYLLEGQRDMAEALLDQLQNR